MSYVPLELTMIKKDNSHVLNVQKGKQHHSKELTSQPPATVRICYCPSLYSFVLFVAKHHL